METVLPVQEASSVTDGDVRCRTMIGPCRRWVARRPLMPALRRHRQRHPVIRLPPARHQSTNQGMRCCSSCGTGWSCQRWSSTALPSVSLATHRSPVCTSSGAKSSSIAASSNWRSMRAMDGLRPAHPPKSSMVSWPSRRLTRSISHGCAGSGVARRARMHLTYPAIVEAARVAPADAEEDDITGRSHSQEFHPTLVVVL
eukprot:scaffold227090_cov34-Tisochrysis_lutea.AAC.3